MKPVPTLLLAALLWAGCGDAPAPRERPARRAEAPPGGSSLPAATYVTLVAWAAEDGRPAGAYWLENRTDGDGVLGRRYRAWRLEGDSARRTLSVDDELRAAAAAWRPLPAPGFRVSVDPAGRLTALETSGPAASRLEVGRELATWRGSTGRRQRLAEGRLLPADSGAAPAPVAVLSLRFERLAGDPGSAGPARTLLLSGRGGRGLLALDEGGARPWSRGWAWNGDGGLRPLGDASLPDTAAGPGAWRFRLPGEGADAGSGWRVRPASPDDSATLPPREETADGPRTASFRLLPVRARVREGRGARPALGFLLLSPASGADPGG